MQSENVNMEELDKIENSTELENIIKNFNLVITATCKETIPSKKKKNKIRVPWWSEQLASLKKEVATRRRRIRNAAPERRPMVVDLYLKRKKNTRQR